jgi:hypothetical protein
VSTGQCLQPLERFQVAAEGKYEGYRTFNYYKPSKLRGGDTGNGNKRTGYQADATTSKPLATVMKS